MAFSFYMNMERLSLEIAESHISNMTNNNYEDDCFLKEQDLINNIKNGFVVITQLSCFFESFLNTIINFCMRYNGDLLLKCSVEEKMDLIFMHYQKDCGAVKSQNPWAVYKKTTKVRNEMIHYKKTYIGDGGGIPNFVFGGQHVASFFTKQNMKSIRDEYEKLAELVAKTLGLSVCKEISIFECDGRDELVNYVYDSNEINVDATRFS